jgi:hypothetical protein
VSPLSHPQPAAADHLHNKLLLVRPLPSLYFCKKLNLFTLSNVTRGYWEIKTEALFSPYFLEVYINNYQYMLLICNVLQLSFFVLFRFFKGLHLAINAPN